MPQLLSIVLPGQQADCGGLASMCLQVLHSAVSGCSAGPARLWPLQLLAWLLQAQRDKGAAIKQVGTSSLSSLLGLACNVLPKIAARRLKHWPLHPSKQQTGTWGGFPGKHVAAGLRWWAALMRLCMSFS